MVIFWTGAEWLWRQRPGVADFVVGDGLLFVIRQDGVLLLVTGDDDFDAFFQVGLADGVAVVADGAQGRFIDDIGQFGAEAPAACGR